jgi:outer membrane protein assembly factor BamB
VSNRDLHGIDIRDGTVTWTKRLPARSESECLASAAGRVCVTGDDGYVRVIDGATGELIWRRDSGMLQLGGPCMTDKCVVYSAGGMITCRDADSGDHIWRILGPGRRTSTPSAWNGRVYVLYEDQLEVYGVRPPK